MIVIFALLTISLFIFLYSSIMSRFPDIDSSADRDSELDLNILEEMRIRKRRPWNPDGSLVSGEIDLLDDDDVIDEEEEDGVGGCPLPSTPEDNQLLEAEVCYIL